ncbi:hypothetical protein [Roseibium aggregatum]|uniref:hypothetical protein n=1 Tax=Roseibium aggregatum TaxID=187304 RepID=UPI001E53D884|nr:hypothetical protein [Roseibium aggregatum]UES46821.1 hypothetical protein GFK90_25290 [Roseibium aggregatum]
MESRVNSNGKSKGAPRWIAPYVDFCSINQLTPTAALLLAAEYDRIRQINKILHAGLGTFLLVNVELWKNEIFSLLLEIGFFDLLEIADLDSQREDPDFRIIRMRSGRKNDPTEVDQLIEELERCFSELSLSADDECFELAGALGEAMENVVRCAYPAGANFKYTHVGRWWMTGAIIKSERRMYVSIYDQGISIPGSLHAWEHYDSFKQRFLRFLGIEPDLTEPKYDGDVIKMAIEESRTSTGLEKHGKGLAHIQAFVDNCSDGRLRIVSRQGVYEYQKGGVKKAYSLDTSIGGTLVEWVVRL